MRDRPLYIFRVGSIEWKSDIEVEVGGGYYASGWGASGNTYTLKKVNGKWQVINDTMNWISYNSQVKRLRSICRLRLGTESGRSRISAYS